MNMEYNQQKIEHKEREVNDMTTEEIRTAINSGELSEGDIVELSTVIAKRDQQEIFKTLVPNMSKEEIEKSLVSGTFNEEDSAILTEELKSR